MESLMAMVFECEPGEQDMEEGSLTAFQNESVRKEWGKSAFLYVYHSWSISNEARISHSVIFGELALEENDSKATKQTVNLRWYSAPKSGHSLHVPLDF